MMMSGYGRTKHPDEVKKFIDFMVNSQEAGKLNQMDRGLPANLDARKNVVADLDSVETG